MNAKDYLMRYQTAKQQVKCEQNQLKFLENLSMTVDSELREAGVSEVRRNSCLKECNEKCEQLRLSILEKLKRHTRVIEEIYSVIECVQNDDYRVLLTYKYINGYTYEEIEELMHISRSNLCRYHSNALEEILPFVMRKYRR